MMTFRVVIQDACTAHRGVWYTVHHTVIRFFRAMPDDGVHQDGAPHGGAIAVTLKAEYESLVQFGDDVQRLTYQQCKSVRLL